MADRYQQFVNTQIGERLADLVGLPKPTPLRRHDPDRPLLDGPVLLGGDGRLVDSATKTMLAADLEIHTDVTDPEETPRYTKDVGASPRTSAEKGYRRQPVGMTYAALVFDATGIHRSADLARLHDFFHTTIRRLGANGRVVVLGTIPLLTEDAAERTAQRSLEGFVRSIAKELRAGGTAQLVEVAPGAEAGLGAPLRFLLSGRSAFVSGQRITLGPATDHLPLGPALLSRPLDGQVAVVTGAAQGIGAAIAATLSRDGAHVVGVDLPSAGQALASVANRVGGTALQLDITAADAPDTLVRHVTQRHGGLDIMVHNAGITRDKTLAGMDAKRWQMVLDVNLVAIEQIDQQLLASGALNDGGRIVCVSSMSGIAGNRGQANYATSKAGIIGHVEALADRLATSGGTINAVAPGFIETDMTDAMPLGTREVGRRISSLGQGGQPVDVAEAIGFFAGPDATWINGTTLRVCGQNLMGA